MTEAMKCGKEADGYGWHGCPIHLLDAEGREPVETCLTGNGLFEAVPQGAFLLCGGRAELTRKSRLRRDSSRDLSYEP